MNSSSLSEQAKAEPNMWKSLEQWPASSMFCCLKVITHTATLPALQCCGVARHRPLLKERMKQRRAAGSTQNHQGKEAALCKARVQIKWRSGFTDSLSCKNVVRMFDQQRIIKTLQGTSRRFKYRRCSGCGSGSNGFRSLGGNSETQKEKFPANVQQRSQCLCK